MTDYYKIEEEEIVAGEEASEGRWLVRLCPEADVYRGHFPGQPIAPGACNIEMVRQLAERLAGMSGCEVGARGAFLRPGRTLGEGKREEGGEYRLKEITQCRFTHLIRPEVENPLEVRVRLEGDKLTAGISHGETVCVTMKAVIVNS